MGSLSRSLSMAMLIASMTGVSRFGRGMNIDQLANEMANTANTSRAKRRRGVPSSDRSTSMDKRDAKKQRAKAQQKKRDRGCRGREFRKSL